MQKEKTVSPTKRAGNGPMNEWMDQQMDRPTDGQTKRWTDRPT